MRRRLATAIALLALALVPTAALGAQQVVRDKQGRPITFDVQAPGVDVAGYARILRGAIHGNEIREVTIRIVPRRAIARACGSGDAVACYRGTFRGPVITVPATGAADVEHALLHEYGHHIDRSRGHRGLPEPNGTPLWWSARGLASRLRAGEVAFDYSLGWTHSVGEIFAEDYVQLHVRGRHGIGWLTTPGDGVLRALRRDLTGRATGPAPRPVTPPPSIPTPGPQTPPIPTTPPGEPGLVIARQGTIERDELRSLPFRLLGSGRRAQIEARGTGAGRAMIEIVCDGRLLDSAEIGDDRPASLDLPGLGPAGCELLLTGTAGTLDYDIRLTLSIEGE